ncbi:MAG: hypothetical protein M5U33_10325 [Pseudorhodoplanes sp.]|nr:hypothetical protein [Pseudorhodoplanes sp.]
MKTLETVRGRSAATATGERAVGRGSARERKRLDEGDRDPVGRLARNPARPHAAVEAGNRHDIGDAERLEAVAQIMFEDEPADIGEFRLRPAHRQFGDPGRRRQHIMKGRGRNLDHHRVGKADVAQIVGLGGAHRERRVITGRPRQKESRRAESGKITGDRAGAAAFAIPHQAGDIEGKQNRQRTVANPGKIGGQRLVEPRQGDLVAGGGTDRGLARGLPSPG